MRRLLPIALLLTSCSNPQQASKPDAPEPTMQTATSKTSSPSVVARDGVRPRYDLAGKRLVHMVGPDGQHDIAMTSGTSAKVFEQEGDDLQPTWTPDGRIVFASNRDGDYDLWVLDPDSGKSSRITNNPGDELEPTVSPIPFGFYAVRNGVCGSSASGRPLDAYYKVLFTQRNADSSEIWFASMPPREKPGSIAQRTDDESFELSAPASHLGRVSADGAHCESAYFGGDGLSAVFVCDGVLQDAPARFEQSFQAALEAVQGTKAPPECEGWEVDFDKCLPKLSRRYATYPGSPVSKPEQHLANPSVSANQTLLLADADGKAWMRPRFDAEASWVPFPIDATDVADITWSPDGSQVAFSSSDGIQTAATDFYLQSVRNLHHFGELFGKGESALLHQNSFVVRPGKEKEFYVLHDKLRYAERPQFISTDVALQVFRDEFLRMLENAEKEAATLLHSMSKTLMDHYVARLGSGSAIDRYYAVLFATAWVPLEAAATLKPVDTDDLLESRYMDESELDPEVKKRVDDALRPVAVRLPEQLPAVYPKVPEAIRKDVRLHVERMLSHAGVEGVSVPGRSKPLKVDFSQFKIRGAYAENDLGAYFLAMNWFASMPLPIDPSLVHLAKTVGDTKVGDKTLMQHWSRVDGLVGSFMGRPVDATLANVQSVLKESPKFDGKQVTKRLGELRGPVPIRDANGGDRGVMVTLFPKRIGLDVTFFRALTHPKVKGRGMPTSLDVFATLGNEQAAKHAIDEAGELADAYRAALDELRGSTGALATTDIYHSWLAMLVTLAQPYQVDDGLLWKFARGDAWRDRQLYGALAGYTQLKHSAVLYAMQDMGVECDGDSSYFVAVEQPIVPRPRGFVEPNVGFYDALTKLAQKTYADIGSDPVGPNADQWGGEDDPRVNAMNFAKDLAAIARDELAHKPLTDEQIDTIEFIGARVEQLTIAMQPSSYSFSTGGDGRAQRGVAIVTDIHTNTDREQALHIGIGRIFDMWVVVPSDVGERLTQGGILSFYEFPHPLSDRMTDAQWGERLESGELPPRPEWTKSFIEER